MIRKLLDEEHEVANSRLLRVVTVIVALLASHVANAKVYKVTGNGGRSDCGTATMQDYPSRSLRQVRWSGECVSGDIFARGVLLFTYRGEATAQWGYWGDGKPSGLHVRLTRGRSPLALVRYEAPGVGLGVRALPSVQSFDSKLPAEESATVREGKSLSNDELQAEVTLWSRRPGITPLEVFNSAPAGLTREERGPPLCCGPNR